MDSMYNFRQWDLETLPRASSGVLPLKTRMLMVGKTTVTFKDSINIQAVDELLAAAGLGLFEYTDTVYFLAALSERISDHDRWLYILQHGEPNAHVYTISPEPIEPNPVYLPVSVSRSVSQIHTAMLRAKSVQLAEPDASGAVETLGELMALRNMLPSTSEPDAQVWRQLVANAHDVHAMLHHHESWRPRHPEFAALPWELVLRMHGMGHWVDERADGSS